LSEADQLQSEKRCDSPSADDFSDTAGVRLVAFHNIINRDTSYVYRLCYR
jgi:hypothetical protein